MHDLRVLILEGDDRRADGLTHRLRALGVRQVRAVSGVDAAMRECRDGRPDLVFCRLDGGEGREVEILQHIAQRPQRAAVMIYGPVADPAHAENVCRRLGLRYLGHLPQPLQEERLRRTVCHLRACLWRE